MKFSYTTILLITFLTFNLSACQQKKVDELNAKMLNLEQIIDEQSSTIEYLESNLMALQDENIELQRQVKKQIESKNNLTDDEIIKAFIDHVNFYCEDHVFYVPKLRRKSENSYSISFDYIDPNRSYSSFSGNPDIFKGMAEISFGQNGYIMVSGGINGPFCINGF